MNQSPTASPWADVSAARLPLASLPALAAVRTQAGVRVHHLEGDSPIVWVTWPTGSSEVLACLQPAREVEFFSRREGKWFRFGARVPTSDRPPSGPGLALDTVLIPRKADPLPPTRSGLDRVSVRLVRGGASHPATALRCPLRDLLPWAETALTAEIEALRAARRGEQVILRGYPPPSIPGATRYWGTTVLIPLGFRTDSDLPSAVLRAVAGVDAGEVLMLDEAGAFVVPESAFAPLRRAAVRAACGQ